MAQIVKKFIGNNQVGALKARLENNSYLRGRNAADDGDVNILKINSSNVIEFASVPQVGGVSLATLDDIPTQSIGEWQDSVLDRAITPPGSPSVGDRYLIDATLGTPTGAWAGQENKIAQYNGSGWDFIEPSTGMFVSVDDENTALYYYGGTSWTAKYFEATTASTGLEKVGMDIRIASSAKGSGIQLSSGTFSIQCGKENLTLTATDITNQYKDLSVEILPNSLNLSVNGVMQYEGSDYTLSVVGGVTRITFIGDLASGGSAALVAGDILRCQYIVK
jgi:hypothetical protein